MFKILIVQLTLINNRGKYEKNTEAQTLRDQGMAAHDVGDHTKSEELLGKAMELFKG